MGAVLGVEGVRWELCWALKVPGEELCLLNADCVYSVVAVVKLQC